MTRSILLIFAISLLASCIFEKERKREIISPVSYPDTIKTLGLELEFDRAKFDLYKFNSVYGYTDLVLKEDSLNFYFKAMKNSNYSIPEIMKDSQKIEEVLGLKKITKYIECELIWFQDKVVQKNGELVFTFFPKIDSVSYSKYDRIHTISYLNDTIYRIGQGGLNYKFPKSNLNEIDSLFTIYLKKNDSELNDWLSKYWYQQ